MTSQLSYCHGHLTWSCFHLLTFQVTPESPVIIIIPCSWKYFSSMLLSGHFLPWAWLRTWGWRKHLLCSLTEATQHLCSPAQFFATPWPVARQAPLSMGFSRQLYWSGLPYPSPGDLPDPRNEPMSLRSPTLAGGFFTTSTKWEAYHLILVLYFPWLIPLRVRNVDFSHTSASGNAWNRVEASSIVSGIEMTFDLSYSKYLTDETWEVHA